MGSTHIARSMEVYTGKEIKCWLYPRISSAGKCVPKSDCKEMSGCI